MAHSPLGDELCEGLVWLFVLALNEGRNHAFECPILVARCLPTNTKWRLGKHPICPAECNLTSAGLLDPSLRARTRNTSSPSRSPDCHTIASASLGVEAISSDLFVIETYVLSCLQTFSTSKSSLVCLYLFLYQVYQICSSYSLGMRYTKL